jgi:hypothetical protein
MRLRAVAALIAVIGVGGLDEVRSIAVADWYLAAWYAWLTCTAPLRSWGSGHGIVGSPSRW